MDGNTIWQQIERQKDQWIGGKFYEDDCGNHAEGVIKDITIKIEPPTVVNGKTYEGWTEFRVVGQEEGSGFMVNTRYCGFGAKGEHGGLKLVPTFAGGSYFEICRKGE